MKSNTDTLVAEPPKRNKRSKLDFTSATASLGKLLGIAQKNSALAKYESPLRYKVFQPGEMLPCGKAATRATHLLQYGSKQTGKNGEIFYVWKFVPVVGASEKDQP